MITVEIIKTAAGRHTFRRQFNLPSCDSIRNERDGPKERVLRGQSRLFMPNRQTHCVVQENVFSCRPVLNKLPSVNTMLLPSNKKSHRKLQVPQRRYLSCLSFPIGLQQRCKPMGSNSVLCRPIFLIKHS